MSPPKYTWKTEYITELIFLYFKTRLASLPQKSLPWKPQCGNGQPEAVAGKVLAAKFLVSEPGLVCTVGLSDTLCHQGTTIPPAVAGLSIGSAD